MKPRYYQIESVQAAWDHMKSKPGSNPCIELPTGAGKSIVIAMMIQDIAKWKARGLLLAHRKELLQQTEEKIHAIAPGTDLGVYSAGLNRRDTDNQIILGGIQSVYKRADKIGKIDLLMVDEAHLIPPEGEGMYQQLIKDLLTINPLMRVVGLTATPYRMKEGYVCGPDHFLNEICYTANVKQLISQGFLCPLVSKATANKADTVGVEKRGGEWVAGQLDAHLSHEDKVARACDELFAATQDRHSVLIFAAGRQHGQAIKEELLGMSDDVAYLDGETPAKERASIIENFRSGATKFLVNIDVLTTGFDATNVDCVVLLRPTNSPGLYYQMVGRGLRIDDTKDDCLVLDFGENVYRHGPIDKMEIKPQAGDGNGEAPTKECPECGSIMPLGYRTCSDCGFTFPEPELKHTTQASEASPISESKPEKLKVTGVTYMPWTSKRNPDGPQTLRVDYQCGIMKTVSEWVCIEHEGWPGEKAQDWWQSRCQVPFPSSSLQAADIGIAGKIAQPISILVEKDGRYDRIVGAELPDDIPTYAGTVEDSESFKQMAMDLFDANEELPF